MGKTWDITFDHRVEQTESPVSTYSPPPANFMPNFPAAQAAILDVASYGLSYGDPVRRATIAQHDLSIMAGRYPYDAELSQRYDWLTDIYSQSNAHVAFIQARPLRYAKAPDFAVPDETQLQRELITATGSADLRYGLWWREGVQQTLLGADVGSHGSAYIVNPDRAAFTGDQEDINDPVAKNVLRVAIENIVLFDDLTKQATQGDNILAPNLNPVDIQNLIDSPAVVDGDTILLPDGDVTWNSPLTISSKSIKLKALNGSPTAKGRTNQNVVVTQGYAGALVSLANGTTNHPVINGIRFIEGSGGSYPFISTSGTGSKIPVVHDCSFAYNDRYGSGAINGIHQITSRGAVFSKCHYRDLSISPDGNYGSNINIINPPSLSENSVDTLGARDTDGTRNIYFEDCTFESGGLCPDCYDDARYVVRNCVIDGTWSETHGFSGTRPGRHFEYYDNVYQNSVGVGVSNGLFWCRGGHGIFADNTINSGNVGYGLPSFVTMSVETAYASGKYPLVYPIPWQVGWGHDGTGQRNYGMWFWGNTINTGNPLWSFKEVNQEPGYPTSSYLTDGVEIHEVEMTLANGAWFDYQKYTYPHPALAEVGL